jgi:hypothetical protein
MELDVHVSEANRQLRPGQRDWSLFQMKPEMPYGNPTERVHIEHPSAPVFVESFMSPFALPSYGLALGCFSEFENGLGDIGPE